MVRRRLTPLTLIVWPGVWLAAGCFGVTFSDGDVRCEQNLICPAGLACVDGECVSEVSGQDAAVDALEPADAPMRVPASCADHRDNGATVSGSYAISIAGRDVTAVCDMETAGGGWTVLVKNDAVDAEPEGCVPRIASIPGLVCGTPGSGDGDFAILATDFEFTELVWAAYDSDETEITAYQSFAWDEATQIPATSLWSLVPNRSSQTLSGLEDVPHIECDYTATGGTSGLRRVANEEPESGNEPWSEEPVVTIFDQDVDATNTGKMSFTDYIGGILGNRRGLDDFQDGRGCNNEWSPGNQRGAATQVMIR